MEQVKNPVQAAIESDTKLPIAAIRASGVRLFVTSIFSMVGWRGRRKVITTAFSNGCTPPPRIAVEMFTLVVAALTDDTE